MNSPRSSWVQHIMGMPISVHMRGPGAPERRTSTVEGVFADLREVDRLFSTYNPDSEVSRLARGDLVPAQAHPLLAEVIDLCEQARQVTEGYFDAWLPTGFDPSGLVKGWAVARACARLAHLDDDYYLNAGGDIAFGCVQPTGRWRIGIEDPEHPDALLGVLALHSGGVATSGTAHRGAHVVDPRTGTPAVALRSVTVVGPSVLWADVYATAVLAAGALDRLGLPDGYEALALSVAGQRSYTSGMRALL